MQEEIFEFIKKFLADSYKDYLDGREINKDENLEDLGINSLAFIKTIVEIEKEYGIEFYDSEIEVSNYDTLSQLAAVTEKKIEEKR